MAAKTVSDGEILTLVAEHDWPVSTTEIASAVGISQQGAYSRLQQLVERGEIEARTVGGTTLYRLA